MICARIRVSEDGHAVARPGSAGAAFGPGRADAGPARWAPPARPWWAPVLLLAALLLPGALSARQPDVPAAPPGAPAERMPVARQLESLLEALEAAEQELGALRQAQRKTTDEAERARLAREAEPLAARVEQLQGALERVATGGADLGLFQKDADTAFDWRQQLEEVVQPILGELQQLTERPRTIERLRRERDHFQTRLPVAERALASISALRREAGSPRLARHLGGLEERWRGRRDYLASQLQAVEVQLQEALAPPEPEPGAVAAHLKQFFAGRGLTALLALSAFLATQSMLIVAGRGLQRLLQRRRRGEPPFFARALMLGLHALSALLSIGAAMVVLYVRGDWLLLGLLGLFLFGLAWALRQSVPRYLGEARVLLNIGPVREGERVLYNGLPWKVAALGLYSTLHNPLLRGGTLRLPIQQLAGLHSRPIAAEEPYFPSREGDFVILGDDTYGRVLLQSAEVVQLEILGAVRTYPTPDYLKASPRNLSARGFALVLTFGLDYRHQAEITTRIEAELRSHVLREIERQPFREQIRSVLVEYSEAAASSLNFLVLAVCDGAAADRYWNLRRFLQRTLLEACNVHGWTVPFAQLTVHTGPAAVPAMTAPEREREHPRPTPREQLPPG
jgi:hypothetical protein